MLFSISVLHPIITNHTLFNVCQYATALEKSQIFYWLYSKNKYTYISPVVTNTCVILNPVSAILNRSIWLTKLPIHIRFSSRNVNVYKNVESSLSNTEQSIWFTKLSSIHKIRILLPKKIRHWYWKKVAFVLHIAYNQAMIT